MMRSDTSTTDPAPAGSVVYYRNSEMRGVFYGVVLTLSLCSAIISASHAVCGAIALRAQETRGALGKTRRR